MTDKHSLAAEGRYPCPVGLGLEAQRVWRYIMRTYTLRIDEQRTLKDICRTMDIVERLQEELKDAPTMVRGSQGQPVTNALFAELKANRLALNTMWKSVRLVDDEASSYGRNLQQEALDAVSKSADKWRKATG